ncbi:MAG: ABC transporter permease [Clostridium sp.]
MRINSVLRNESKLTVRTWKFPLMVLVYSLIVSGVGVFMYYASTRNAIFEGLSLNTPINIYLTISLAQTVLLLFMVPSMTSTAISSEREKQTLDVLLSTKLSSFSIIIGKLFSSVSKVLILLFLTLPVYALTFLIGGVSLKNIVELMIFLIITTFFVGAIGIFFSTFLKTSKGATAATYGVVLFIFIGIFVLAYGMFIYKSSNATPETVVLFPKFVSLSPVAGYFSMLSAQVGVANLTMGPLGMIYPMITMNGFGSVTYFSMGMMIVCTILLIIVSSYKLNPINNKSLRVRFKRKKK